MSEKEKVPLRKKSWFIIVLLIIFFPVGLYLMWKHASWGKTAKWGVTGVIALLIAYNLGTQDSSTNTADTTNTETNQPVVEETDEVSAEETDEETEPAEDVEEKEVEKTEPVEDVEEVETESSDQEESASEEEEVVEEEEADDVVGLATPLNVGDVEFTVNNWEQSASVGSDFLMQEANDTYIVMDVTVVNNGNESITVDSSYFKIVNGESTYEPDTMASTYANNDGLGLFFEQINPGSSRNALVVFDVAQSVVDSTEKQVQVQSGIWGTETGLINLQ